MSPTPVYASDRRTEQFYELLDSSDPRVRLYVYRWDGVRAITPPIYKGTPIPELEEYLQREYDGGDFQVMIRRGETMAFTGLIAICPLPSRKEAFEAYKAKAGW